MTDWLAGWLQIVSNLLKAFSFLSHVPYITAVVAVAACRYKTFSQEILLVVVSLFSHKNQSQ